MVFKKVLISLAALGVAGGTGTGIYYLKNKSSDETVTAKTQTTPTDGAGGTSLAAVATSKAILGTQPETPKGNPDGGA